MQTKLSPIVPKSSTANREVAIRKISVNTDSESLILFLDYTRISEDKAVSLM